MTTLRSALFLLGALIVTPVFGVLVSIGGLVHRRVAFFLASTYTRWMLRWVEWSCGISYEVHGWENVPSYPVVLMSKHQSAWETLFIETHFPPQCWVVSASCCGCPSSAGGSWRCAASRSTARAGRARASRW
jgi:1-acyl-sn-glycerol-3-phosphate acyltransferase